MSPQKLEVWSACFVLKIKCISFLVKPAKTRCNDLLFDLVKTIVVNGFSPPGSEDNSGLKLSKGSRGVDVSQGRPNCWISHAINHINLRRKTQETYKDRIAQGIIN